MDRFPRYYVLDDDGEPLAIDDVVVWGTWFETADRRVALDTVGDVEISTVFLGLDHQFAGGPPVLWETMMFRGGAALDYQNRYTSRAAALAGHAAAVALVQAPKAKGTRWH